MLAPTSSESSEKTRSENQKVPVSSLNEQLTGTVKPVTHASSSNSSEWNNDDKWSSQVRKSGEMSETSPGKPVDDKFVIDYDVDSDTFTESNFSLKSLSILNRVNDRLRKRLDHYSKDAMQDIGIRSIIWKCLCLQHWKHLYSWERITQTIYIPSKTKGKISL